MSKKERIGLLTERQLEILDLRKRNMSYDEIAKKLGTTPENVYILEKRALRNLRLAFETIKAAVAGNIVMKVKFEKGTKLVNIPPALVNKADEAGIKLKGNFTKIFDDIRYSVPDSISKNELVKDIYVYIMSDGTFFIASENL
ncbi:MAG: Tfx family DNA-binding protein [Nitrososphaeria archaeon]